MGKIKNIIFIFLITLVVIISLYQSNKVNKNPEEHIFFDIDESLYTIDFNSDDDKAFFIKADCSFDDLNNKYSFDCQDCNFLGSKCEEKQFNLIQLSNEDSIIKRKEIKHWKKLNSTITIICVLLLLFIILFNIYRAKYKPEQWKKTPLAKIINWINKKSK